MSSNQLVDEAIDPRLMIGGNNPPLGERLAESSAPLLARLEQLVGVASDALIRDDASCAKVVDLLGMCRAHFKTVTTEHQTEALPYKQALDTVDGVYRPIEQRLSAIIGANAREGLRGMITQYEAKRQAEADAEKARLAQEQRQREAEAEEARRRLEEKRTAGNAGVKDELAVLHAEDEAARLGQRAEAIRPVPIRANLGNVGVNRQPVVEIVDLRKLCGWLLKSPIRPSLEEACLQLIRRWVRHNIGVTRIEQHGVDIPGVEVKIERVAAVR
jgi:hypothetical protein